MSPRYYCLTLRTYTSLESQTLTSLFSHSSDFDQNENRRSHLLPDTIISTSSYVPIPTLPTLATMSSRNTRSDNKKKGAKPTSKPDESVPDDETITNTPQSKSTNAAAVTEDGDRKMTKEEKEADAKRQLLFADKDSFEESDEEGFEGQEGFEGTCIVQHWIPDPCDGPNSVKMGAVCVTPTRNFMDKLLTHPLLQRKDSSKGGEKKEFLDYMGKNLVPRVITQYINGDPMEAPGKGGDVFEIKGVVFNYRKMTRENVEKLVSVKVCGAMDKFKGHWTMPEASKPVITEGNKECRVVKKLSYALSDDDIYWYIQHTFKGNWKKLFMATETIYQIWDEGEVPVKTFQRKGINKNLLKQADQDNYDALDIQPPAAKKQRSG